MQRSRSTSLRCERDDSGGTLNSPPSTEKAPRTTSIDVDDSEMYTLLSGHVKLADAVPDKLFVYPERPAHHRKDDGTLRSHHEKAHWGYIDDQNRFLTALLQTTKGRNVKHTGFTRQVTHFLTVHKLATKFERGEIEDAALNVRRMIMGMLGFKRSRRNLPQQWSHLAPLVNAIHVERESSREGSRVAAVLDADEDSQVERLVPLDDEYSESESESESEVEFIRETKPSHLDPQNILARLESKMSITPTSKANIVEPQTEPKGDEPKTDEPKMEKTNEPQKDGSNHYYVCYSYSYQFQFCHY